MCPGLACYQTAIIHRTDRPAVLSGRIGFGCGPGWALSRAHSDKLDLDTWTCTKREFTVEGHVGQYYGVFFHSTTPTAWLLYKDSCSKGQYVNI